MGGHTHCDEVEADEMNGVEHRLREAVQHVLGPEAAGVEPGPVIVRSLLASLRRFFLTKVGRELDSLTLQTLLHYVTDQDRRPDLSALHVELLAVATQVHRRSVQRRARAIGMGAEMVTARDLLSREDLELVETRMPGPLADALRRLPMHLQVIMEFHFVERLTNQEISRVVGAEVDWVERAVGTGVASVLAVSRELRDAGALREQAERFRHGLAALVETGAGGNDLKKT